MQPRLTLVVLVEELQAGPKIIQRKGDNTNLIRTGLYLLKYILLPSCSGANLTGRESRRKLGAAK